MYEELIKALRCRQNKEGKPCLSCSCQQQNFCDIRHDMEAADALEELAIQLAALQSENAELLTQHRTEHCEAAGYDCEELGRLMSANAEKDKEIERLKSELLEAREDYMASEMEREQGVAALSRVEAERDAAYNHICDQCDILPCLEDECPWWRGAQGEA